MVDTFAESNSYCGLEAGSLAETYRAIRQASRELCEPLEPEDCCIQSMPDVSPTKWHLAHTSWFFETFVLKAALPGFRSPDPQYEYLFNSYYNAVGQQYARPERGHLSRPTLAEVMDYRTQIDEAMEVLFASEPDRDLLAVVQLGTHHEHQHQQQSARKIIPFVKIGCTITRRGQDRNDLKQSVANSFFQSVEIGITCAQAK